MSLAVRKATAKGAIAVVNDSMCDIVRFVNETTQGVEDYDVQLKKRKTFTHFTCTTEDPETGMKKIAEVHSCIRTEHTLKSQTKAIMEAGASAAETGGQILGDVKQYVAAQVCMATSKTMTGVTSTSRKIGVGAVVTFGGACNFLKRSFVTACKVGLMIADDADANKRARVHDASGDSASGGSASAAKLNQERNDQQSDDGIEQGEASSERGNKCKVCGLRFHLCVCQETKEKTTTAADEVTCKVCFSKPCTCAADEARERALLRELYAALVAPVDEHLTGAEEVLIVPHKELFEVPWAALIDAHGHFLIERHVLRVAPSLRVAQQAADSAAQGSARRPGHIVLVGNPLPIRSGFDSLPYAQQEAQGVHDSLKRANVLVKPEHFYIGLGSDSHPKATKANVKKSLEDAGWAHLALHSDKDTKTLVLAVPESKSDPDHAQPDLSMLEVQGSDEAADKRERVRLAEGATVVLSACNTGCGDILAEGVVGLARGFLLAGAAAAVVSLWSVDDGSTAALMEQMYRHLVEGCTVPQALRLAMLRLAGRPALDQPVSEQDVADGLQEAWKRPMHWAGFLVMGASTRLPRGDI